MTERWRARATDFFTPLRDFVASETTAPPSPAAAAEPDETDAQLYDHPFLESPVEYAGVGTTVALLVFVTGAIAGVLVSDYLLPVVCNQTFMWILLFVPFILLVKVVQDTLLVQWHGRSEACAGVTFFVLQFFFLLLLSSVSVLLVTVVKQAISFRADTAPSVLYFTTILVWTFLPAIQHPSVAGLFPRRRPASGSDT